jgi:hypothetical protein
MNVFLLWHVNALPGGEEDSKVLGVYSTRVLAEPVQKRAVQLPGFRELPNGFTIDSYDVDRDEWREGYVTVYPGS